LRGLIKPKDVRLVTILGPNGVGKTRLSLELSHELLSNYNDGAFFVSLASLTDPYQVATAIAQLSASARPAMVLSQKPWQTACVTVNFYCVG